MFDVHLSYFLSSSKLKGQTEILPKFQCVTVAKLRLWESPATLPLVRVMSGNEAPPSTSPEPPNFPIGSQKKHPCLLCQQRKVKCDRNEPCFHCRKAGVDCVSPPQHPQRRRKRRFPEAELLARIRRYEHHLKSYGADIDAINREDKMSVTELPMLNQTGNSPVELLTGPLLLNGTHSLSIRRSLKHVEK